MPYKEKEKMAKKMTSCIFQFTPPSWPNNDNWQITNHNNQCPPSLFEEIVTNSCLNESLLSYYVSKYIPTNTDHITPSRILFGLERGLG